MAVLPEFPERGSYARGGLVSRHPIPHRELLGDMSYGCVHRDQRHQSCEVKEGRLRHKYHDGNAWRSERLPLDSPEIPRYYRVILHLRLTGDERGKEEDSMGLDLLAEFVKLDDPFDFEILSYDVI